MKIQILLFIVFFSFTVFCGCSPNNSMPNQPTGEIITSEITTDKMINTSSLDNTGKYSFTKGILIEKNWDESSLQVVRKNVPTGAMAINDADKAIDIAEIIFEAAKQKGLFQSYVLISVFLDTEDYVWIVNYGEVPLIPGAGYSIALDGYSGEAICTWRGE